MNLFKKYSLGSRLLDLLADERVILTSGNLNALEAIGKKKEVLILALTKGKETVSKDELSSITIATSIVESLYISVKKGLISADVRLKGIRESSIRLETYSIDGGKISSPYNRRETKA